MTEDEKRKAGLIHTNKRVLQNHFNYYYLIEAPSRTSQLLTKQHHKDQTSKNNSK